MKQNFYYISLLFWLKARLLWRTYTRDMSAAVGAILLLITLFPLALFVAWGLAVGFHALDPSSRAHLLRGVLFGAYVLWLLSPLLGYALTEDFDISKLLPYPISPRQILAGLLAGSVFDIGLLLLVPGLLVILISFSSSLAALPFVLITLIFFLVHTLALSQALNILSAGLFRSRRGREFAFIFVILITSSSYLIAQFFARGISHYNWSNFTHGMFWRVVGFTPPGLAARAIAAADQGAFLAASVWLLMSGLLAVATAILAGWVVHTVYTGEASSGSKRPRPNRAPREAALPTPPVSAPGILGRIVPGTIEALVVKDIKYLLRDPLLRLMLLQLGMVLVMGLFIGHGFTQFPAASMSFSTHMMWMLSSMALLFEFQLLSNMFGIEGFAASVLFLFPCPRRHIVFAKNITFFFAFSVSNALIAVIFGGMAHRPELSLHLLLWLELGLIVLLAAGNVISIWFPYRIVMRGWRMERQSASRKFTYAFVSLLAMAGVGVLLLPVFAAIAIPGFHLVPPIWLALSLPFASLYVAGLYLLSLSVAEKLLSDRELNMIEQLTQVD